MAHRDVSTKFRRKVIIVARSKSGRSRRRTKIRHRQKRRKDRRKLARKLGVSIEDLLAMMKKGEVKRI